MIGITGALLGALVTITGTFVELRPNRILSGEGLSAIQAFGPGGWVLLACWLIIGAASVVDVGRASVFIRGFVANATIVLATVLAATRADSWMAEQGEVARLSLGISAWLTVLATYIAIFSATHADRKSVV